MENLVYLHDFSMLKKNHSLMESILRLHNFYPFMSVDFNYKISLIVFKFNFFLLH